MTAAPRYLSVCSGIEAASVAWAPLGFQPVAFSEIEAFPSAVLAHQHPGVPNWGDMTKFKEWPDAHVDVLVGGTPCQSFSVAGLRRGLDDPRGSLMLTYLAIAGRYRPRWLVWENVPGVLSSNRGRDFGSFLGALGQLGYGWAYRVLDAQWFGVAQRRRRVFVVGHLGDWRRAAAVLFERESVRRDTAPRRETGQRAAPRLAARTRGGGGLGTDAELDGALIPAVCPTLRAGGNSTGGDRPPGTNVDTADSLIVAHAFDARQSDILQYGDRTGPLDTDGHSVAVAFTCKDHGADAASDIAPTLRAMGHASSHANGGGQMAVAMPMQVRRLTPRECERLQGFPDDYTAIPWRGRAASECPDGPRYKSLGNSMAVPVMSWIGRRIKAAEVDPFG
jgi:DNA (cytosine-5)-methyltransferase 1